MATTGEPFGLFWDSENGDRTYSAASFEYWLKKFFTSGVFNGDLQVKAKSGMTLEIDPGYANVDGKVKFWNGAFTVTLDAANSTYPRIDTIIIRRDNVNRQIICEKVTGSYSADTPQPTAPTRNSEIYDLVTAQIYVGAGVTEITQSNITDTRPNNELCGYITGTVEELDFSAFTAQFEAYFAEFKRNQMADFQAWEVAQQAAYAAWFSLVQQQQIQDKADWDAWYAALQEELHELPEDTAEYLQIEIDEIRTSGTTGSILKITTTETSLEGKTVTVTNGTETRTATFDENLECLIAGYKGTGEVTISSSDGIQTATTVVTIPYFGNYTYNIAFWAATVNIQGDDNLKGATITVKDSDDLTVGTVVLNVITGRGVFNASKADTYTFNFTFQGTDYSESLVVDEQITYSLSLSAGFDWRGWVDTARFLDSTDYNSLDEVLADEEAVRELCLEHNCVDYLADIATASEDVETIINNDLFAKWVNNSDYALDFLYANAVIADLMDEADKYFYGEWVIVDDTTTPPTWQPKGNVPIMTANTAPYGEASSKDYHSDSQVTYYAYHAFSNDAYPFVGSSANTWMQYKFTNPVCVKEFLIASSSNERTAYVIVQGSNDGFVSDTHDLTSEILTTTTPTKHKIENDNYYLYYRIYCNRKASTSNMGIQTLQFYGRELKVSVPKMGTNTTPYGEASATNVYSYGGNSFPAYLAFDGDDSTRWIGTSFPNTIYYEFPSQVKICMFTYMGESAGNLGKDIALVDGNSNDAVIESYTTVDTSNIQAFTVSNPIETSKYGLKITNVWGSASNSVAKTLQFYGKDYSEKEFEEGTTKKWLYDHGVELESITLQSSSTVVKESSQIVSNGDTVSDGVASIANFASVDLSSYSIIRGVLGNKHKKGAIYGCIFVAKGDTMTWDTSTWLTWMQYTTYSNPYADIGVDISSINESKKIAIATGSEAARQFSIKELWLE